jgi:cytidylate kinase
MHGRRQHHAIAIDGPAASGKTTLARKLAARLGLIMVNSGEMYRAVTWELLRRGIDPADRAAVVAALATIELRCGVRGGLSKIEVGGVDPGPGLRSDEVNAQVSEVAAVPEVRARLVALQRGFIELGDVVMEGRDIGSVVFPETPFKIYIDAPEPVRSARREADGERDAVGRRDAADSGRHASPLRVADGAAVLDTTDLDPEATVEAALQLLRAQGLDLADRVAP